MQMLSYNSGTFCGYRLYSVAIGHPANFSQTKACSFPSPSEFERVFQAWLGREICSLRFLLKRGPGGVLVNRGGGDGGVIEDEIEDQS